MRVISLAPTHTEVLAALGHEPAGVTIDCDYPATVSTLPRFGSWYAPDLHRVLQARADLVCTFGKHQEELARALTEAGCSVYHSDPGSVEASLESIQELAEMLDRHTSGEVLVAGLRRRLDRVRHDLAGLKPTDRPRVFRIMHWQPLITVGPSSFQHDVIGLAGGLNIMADGPAPYFACDPRVVQNRNPDAIFFCEPHLRARLSEGAGWDKVNAVRDGRIFIFDCGLTCRSGPRIVDMVEQLARALHPSGKP